ncbi:N-6 DNA methylase [Paraferrimonas sp. SM1919]|uniref:N-6 DNA methylase n=1 Tax=Paraferrimonas sp. SM1919 TaxID=2662263 RepID=UPI0013D4302A|nr:N-6 DNA methylase [Paraferrimonas sp. SM1919]
MKKHSSEKLSSIEQYLYINDFALCLLWLKKNRDSVDNLSIKEFGYVKHSLLDEVADTILPGYQPSANRISESKLTMILTVLNELLASGESSYSDLFEYLCSMVLRDDRSFIGGLNFYQPLTQLCVDLLNIDEGTVYLPFNHSYIFSQALPAQVEAVYEEENLDIQLLAHCQSLLLEQPFSLKQVDPIYGQDYASDSKVKTYDYCLTVPKFDIRNREEVSHKAGDFPVGTRQAFAEVCHAINHSKGKTIALLPAHELFRKEADSFRKQLIEDNLLEGVIKLPIKLASSRGRNLLLIFNNIKETSQVVFMDANNENFVANGLASKGIYSRAHQKLDASAILEEFSTGNSDFSTVCDNEILLANNAILDPAYYLTITTSEHQQKMLEHEAYLQQHNAVALEEYFEVISPTTPLKNVESDDAITATSYSLQKDADRIGCLTGEGRKLKIRPPRNERALNYQLRQNDILIQRLGPRESHGYGKAALVHEAVATNSFCNHAYILRLKEGLDTKNIPAFMMYFQSKYWANELDKLHIGGITPVLPANAVKYLKVPSYSPAILEHLQQAWQLKLEINSNIESLITDLENIGL